MASLATYEHLALWGPPIVMIIITLWYYYYTGKKQKLAILEAEEGDDQ